MPKNKTNWAVRASTRVRHALTHVYADSGIVRTARRSLRSATVVGLSMLLLITSAGAAAFADTTVNKTALTAAINAEYSDGAARTTLILQAADYTLASQQAYITTLDAAIAVEASATATQAQVDAATASIAAVKATLVFANQAAMDAAVAAANAKVETDYSTTSWAAFITARTSALALPVATNADEGARLAALDSAMSLLVPIGAAVPVSGVDKSALTAAINAEYSDGAARTTLILQAADYTLASQQAYITTLDAAIAVEASATATQAQVDAATASIAAVKATLVRVTGTATSTSSTASSTAPTTNGVDKTALTAAINGEYLDGALRTTLILQAANYTLASQQAYIGALDAAIAVEANPSATQAQVDAATASIAAVKATLVQVGTVATTTNNTASSTVPVVNGVDKTALTAAINGEYLDGSLRTTLILQAANYTPASQQAYISTLDAAIAVEASTTVTQAQVDAATASIAAVKTTLLTVGGGPAGGTGTTTATSTDTLAQAKIAAHSALTIAQSAYVQANYSPENWLILTAAKSAGDAAIDAATTTDTILSARTVAISAMTAVQTIVEQNNALIALLSSNIATTSLSLSTSTMILSASSTHTSLIIIPQEVIDPQIDLSPLVVSGTATMPSSIIVNTNSAVSNVSVLIPAGTKIAVDGGVWNGILSLPTATTTYAAPTPSAGMTATVLSAITIGLGNTPVALSAPAKLTFPGQAGKLAGWSQNGVYHTITNTCDSTNTPTVATSSDCAINSGNDLLVFTRHFTTFVTYTQSPIPVVNNPAPSPTPSSGSASAPATPLHETSNGIGNNGNGPIGLFGTVNVPFPLAYGITNSDLAQATTSSQKNVIVITPQSHTVKSSHKTTTKHTSSKSSSAKSNARFTQTLQRGSHGAEVTRLQSLLIGKGFLSGATTGYFGPLTENAVRAYQKANGLSPVGIVGTTTRGLLNNALASSTAPAAKH